MTTFANIFNEADQILQMNSDFISKYLITAEVKKNSPAIAIPAAEPKQGEQKIPVVKPNGITR